MKGARTPAILCQPARRRPKRPSALTAILVLLALLNLFGLYLGLSKRVDFLTQYSKFTPALWQIYAANPLVTFAAVIALWFWQKWGFWLLCLSALVVMAIAFYTTGWSAHMLRVPLALALLVLFLRPVWQELD
ncbi:MAG: hypothetical protein ONB48_15195 [candidate division KSB1 bacterium]|nr:hypothetical protein [candidate division KSB1 bacterium]MDZ7273416.1 hypothetical protein [candidate division KSB1 bacterium]MDZ7286991.1 hypothetical protein [candidate division KSB1 bacterium]MDZ7299656.1 hypothetical protein [candidate division KSB1 bacterium]MDZ7350767.1 hypothetical protein [candidate division KSB1 bacterium]